MPTLRPFEEYCRCPVEGCGRENTRYGFSQIGLKFVPQPDGSLVAHRFCVDGHEWDESTEMRATRVPIVVRPTESPE